jgi:DNA polymerase
MPRNARSPQVASSAAALAQGRTTIDALTEAAAGCRACDLWKTGTQTVFGDGSRRARVMLVGEQPGDKEDLAGEPFVGPAGRILDEALERAGIDRAATYVTNAVKHFKWEARGKRRIHRKPNAEEIGACRPWLDAEMSVLHPDVVVCLGATAAQALLGKKFRVTQHRGELFPGEHGDVIATVHPSSILRAPDDATRRGAMEAFVEDLRKVAARIDRAHAAPRRAVSP